MANRTLKRLQETLENIESGKFSNSETEILFVKLRSTKKSKVISDLANFIAHAEGRNQGEIYLMIREYIIGKLDDLENFGLRGDIPPPIYAAELVVTELIKTLQQIGLNPDEVLLWRHADLIINHIKTFIDEKEIKINDSRLKKCWLEKMPNGSIVLFFEITNFKNKLIKMTGNGSILITSEVVIFE